MTTLTDQIAPWIGRYAGLIKAGEVLDLACGRGRHAHYLAALGHPVLALDRDAEALTHAAGPGIVTLQYDVEQAPWPFAAGRFAGIVVSNYLHRPLMAALIASLAPDGILLYQTFSAGNGQFGKPSNPDFLLAPGELLTLATRHGLSVLAFEDGAVSALRPAMLQRLCALGPAFPRAQAFLASE